MQGENVYMKKKIKEVLKKILKQKKSRYGVNEKEPEKLIQDRTSQNDKSSEMIT